jgi:hypothetical protein
MLRSSSAPCIFCKASLTVIELSVIIHLSSGIRLAANLIQMFKTASLDLGQGFSNCRAGSKTALYLYLDIT